MVTSLHPGHYNQVNGYPLQIATPLPSLPTTSAQNTSTSVTSEASQPVSSKLSGPPAPPMGLHVQRVVGRHSLLLAWKAPLMDELARSNGVQVTGYRLQIDGRDKQDLPSPHLTKALIEHLNLRKAHHFTLQTVSTNGGSSRPRAHQLRRARTIPCRGGRGLGGRWGRVLHHVKQPQWYGRSRSKSLRGNFTSTIHKHNHQSQMLEMSYRLLQEIL